MKEISKTFKEKPIDLPPTVGIAIVGSKKTAITCFRYSYLNAFRDDPEVSNEMLIHGLGLIDKFCRKSTLEERKYFEELDADFASNPDHILWILPSFVLNMQEKPDHKDGNN